MGELEEPFFWTGTWDTPPDLNSCPEQRVAPLPLEEAREAAVGRARKRCRACRQIARGIELPDCGHTCKRDFATARLYAAAAYAYGFNEAKDRT